MKIKQEHFDLIHSAMLGCLSNGRFVESVLKTRPTIEEAIKAYQDAYKESPCNPVKIFMWDWLRAAKINGNTSTWICDNLYSYLNDDHIETAVKKILVEAYPPAKDLLN